MNPQPVAESIGDCYPNNYGPHRAAESKPKAEEFTSLTEAPSSIATKPWYMRLGAGRIPGLKGVYDWLSDKKSEVIPANTPGKSAIEIGCANGDFLMRLRDNGWDVQGVEPALHAADTAKSLGLTIHHGTLDTVSLPEASVDAVFAWMVIEHLPQPVTTLGQIHRLLKPNGILAFSVPNFGCWEPVVFGRQWDAYELPRHLQHFTPKTVKRMLEANGFADVEIVHQRSLLNVVGSLGFKLRSWKPNSKLAARLIAWPHSPGMWSQLALSPIAKLLAVLRQGGRLTITARRAEFAAAADESNA